MIFISGVHGVGKSYFCNMVKKRLGIETYSASELIADKRKLGFNKDKLVSNAEDNQHYLLTAIDELREKSKDFIIDGHFCLLDTYGRVKRLGIDVFVNLCPDTIVLLMEKPEIICHRRKERDSIDISIESVNEFQTEEKKYAEEIAMLVGAKLYISSGAEDLERIIKLLGSV